MNTAPDAIISADQDLRIIIFNQAAERMLECPTEKAMGLSVTTFIPEDDCRPAEIEVQNGQETRILDVQITRETAARRHDGKSFPAEISVSRTVAGDDEVLTIILRDITDRKQAEAELAQLNEDLERRVEKCTQELRSSQFELLKRERLSALGQLTATVIHEIRNPLGAMRSWLYVIEQKMGNGDPELTRAMDRVKRSVSRCDGIVNELLDFSRVRDLELEATNIDRWLRDVLDEQLLPEGVTLSFEPGLPESLVPIDCERLRRAVVNVVENAVQAIDGEETEGQVTVSTVRAGDNFEIRIKDTGPGIPEDLRKRIFEPLFSTKNSGCGLGLAISKEIIEQHGGTIGIEDGPSGGTCFVFRLPS